jgi:superfamily II DNA or RNA helicase
MNQRWRNRRSSYRPSGEEKNANSANTRRSTVAELENIYSYMREFSAQLGTRILEEFPALQKLDDPISPRLDTLLRRPFPAQNIAIMSVAKRWEQSRTALIVAECGTGKTLISLSAIHVHSQGKPYTALAMAPPHLVEKWAREALLTIPGIRVFLIDDMRNGGEEKAPHGVNEVRLRRGVIVREGLHTTLSDLRLRKQYGSSRERWFALCHGPALFIVGRERAKLGYFWRHAYAFARSGPNAGCLVNAETGKPVIIDDERLTVADFKQVKLAQTVEARGDKSCRTLHSPLWQADPEKIHRMAPVEFIGRHMRRWFDYAICDEIHQLAGDTAQGNALGTLASCTDKIVGLTGTLLGGYADDLFNTLYRLEAGKMKERGYEWGSSGRGAFAQDYGVLETITRIEAEDNACSKSNTSVTVRRKPGASPLLFGEFLMQLCAFVFLEDISGELPPYDESFVSVQMDERLRIAYEALEEDIRAALKEHKGNRSVLSNMLNALLLYPDHSYGLGTLYGTKFDPELGRKVKFVIAHTQDLPQDCLYAKERQLIDQIKNELAEGRRCQVYAVYTQKRDVTARLEQILAREGIRTAVLRRNVPTDKREAWYARKVKEGVQVVIAHPKLVETGLDLLDFPTIIFYESGYSLHTLRQAARRSWRIGQKRRVRVKFMCYEGTMQTSCLRLMGKKLLVALTMEGKFAGEGLQNIDDDDDMLSAMARELVEKNGIGDSADAIWKTLHQQHQKLIAANTQTPETSVTEELPAEMSSPQDLITSAINMEPVLIFGQRPESLTSTRKRSRESVPEQPSLFGWN